jgi:SAM-dependent methyltransferase
VSPLGGFPDRILFSARDTLTGDRTVHTVYYDSAGGAALTYPPVSAGRLRELYDRLHAAGDAEPKPPVAPDPTYLSPYAGYVGSRLGKLFTRLPSPYWWFNRPQFGDTTVDELLALLADYVPLRARVARVLNVGCFRGEMLDALRTRTAWALFGTETNADAAAVARAKGYTVWDVSAQDAAQAIPIGQQFDVILLGHTLEHLQNPTMVLRRLRQLLVPGGLVAFNAPNLDSKHAELFGPTWAGWQLPYHRTILGRKGVQRMAALADMKVVALRTRTHPYPATASAQLNALGLGGVVPEGAKFPNEISSRGVRLTGWSRMLWDWHGRGDFLYAVLKCV